MLNKHVGRESLLSHHDETISLQLLRRKACDLIVAIAFSSEPGTTAMI